MKAVTLTCWFWFRFRFYVCLDLAFYVKVAYCYRFCSMVHLSISLSVCLFVNHDRVFCKNGWADWDIVWLLSGLGPKESCI